MIMTVVPRKKVKRKASAIHIMRRGRTRTITRFVRRGARRARGGLGGMGGLKTWFKAGAAGVGGGTLGQIVEGYLGNPTGGMAGKYGGAYFAGGTKGVLAMLIVDLLTGQGNILGAFGLGRNGGGGDSL
ncbi:MAG: hypothetical protein L0Y56_10680 [Nitrospira sp.]|nr:hypothetical protein [Nitrospira sp.]